MRAKKKLTFSVDFDGTLVRHEFPGIGQPVPHAVEVCKKLTDAGHKLILLTMRSGLNLHEAKRWCEKQGIELYNVNHNPTQKAWTSSPKVYADYFIDDAAIGCPLVYPEGGGRPYVDWQMVERRLQNLKAL